MKNINKFCLILGLLFTILSCSKTNEQLQEDRPITSLSLRNLGEMHNDMLEIYYSHDVNSKSANSLKQKIEIVDSYFLQQNISPSFSDLLDSIPEMYDFLALVDSSNLTLAQYAALFEEFRVEGWSTEKELEYQLEVIERIAQGADIDMVIDGIVDVKQMVMVDQLIDEAIKSRMIDALDISLYSLDYWNTQEKRLPWYARDMMGAVFAWNSGMAAVGAAVGGGAPGAAAVMVGCAAISSMV